MDGYGSDANSSTGQVIRKNLSSDFNLITHSFSNDYELFGTMSENIEQARDIIESMNVDLVVASSMGAFIAMACFGVAKILINPCMLPFEQLKRRIIPDITDTVLQEYRDFESSLVRDEEGALFNLPMVYSLHMMSYSPICISSRVSTIRITYL